MKKQPATALDRDESLVSFFKSDNTTTLAEHKLLIAQMDSIIEFMDCANHASLTSEQDTEEDEFIQDLKGYLSNKPPSLFNQNEIASRVKARQQYLLRLINRSFLPEEIKNKFRANLNGRNEKEYYRQVALIVGTAIFFAFAPISFALAGTGHALYATAAAMVGIGLALMSYSKIKNTPTVTWAFDALNGPQWNAKEFKGWVNDLNNCVTESLPKVNLTLRHRRNY